MSIIYYINIKTICIDVDKTKGGKTALFINKCRQN